MDIVSLGMKNEELKMCDMSHRAAFAAGRALEKLEQFCQRCEVFDNCKSKYSLEEFISKHSNIDNLEDLHEDIRYGKELLEEAIYILHDLKFPSTK